MLNRVQLLVELTVDFVDVHFLAEFHLMLNLLLQLRCLDHADLLGLFLGHLLNEVVDGVADCAGKLVVVGVLNLHFLHILLLLTLQARSLATRTHRSLLRVHNQRYVGSP